MRKEIVEIQDTYDKEGYWIKRTANDVPMFIPEQKTPMVQIINFDTEWIMQKKFMTKEEFKNIYPDLLPPLQGDNK